MRIRRAVKSTKSSKPLERKDVDVHGECVRWGMSLSFVASDFCSNHTAQLREGSCNVDKVWFVVSHHWLQAQ